MSTHSSVNPATSIVCVCACVRACVHVSERERRANLSSFFLSLWHKDKDLSTSWLFYKSVHDDKQDSVPIKWPGFSAHKNYACPICQIVSF